MSDEAPILHFVRQMFRRFLRVSKLDLALFTAIAVIGSVYVFQLSGHVPVAIFDEDHKPANIWFQADAGRIFDNMALRWGNHGRTATSPLFSLIVHPPTFALQAIGVPALTAVRLIISATGGLFLAVLFVVLTQFGLRRLDAALFTVLASVSASFVFLATVPETFLFGGLTVATAMLVPARATQTTVSRFWQTAANAFSLALAVSNWLTGIISAFVLNDRKRFFQICRDGFLIVTVLWCAEKAIFPSARFFLMTWETSKNALGAAVGDALDKSIAFFLHSIAVPRIGRIPGAELDAPPFLSVDRVSLLTHDWLGGTSVAIWLLIAAFGALAACGAKMPRRFFLFVASATAAQLLLRLVFQEETFLYSLHWLPLLIGISAAGALTRYRIPVLIAVAALTIALGANNLARFFATTAEVSGYQAKLDVTDERTRVLAAMRAHPHADWPRSVGHVVLGLPGAPLAAKGYVEPGGSFSPGFGSFGISFVVFDRAGRLVASSNRLPLREIAQRLEETDPGGGYALQTETRYYAVVWETTGVGSWRLTFRAPPGSDLTPVIRITSTGPAGGPLKSVRRNGGKIRINGAWSIAFDNDPIRSGIDSEFRAPVRHPPPLDLSAGPVDIAEADGFAGLSFELEPATAYIVDIRRDLEAPAVPPIETRPEKALELTVPDSRFRDSLFAQLAHLKMGLVDRETRPGDPAHYPLEWLRDGAYTLVALARAGGGAYVAELATGFAEKDFFGGFAAEADAPGLAIWALEEVASRMDDLPFKRKIWPHVKRKAGIILEMIAARRPVRKAFSGLVDPSLRNRPYSYLTRIAQPSRDGLIVGKMDEHQPIFYVNAVSYLGLLRAAQLADELGHDADARSWRTHAAHLRKAWLAALPWHDNRSNSRTLISGIWPSAIVSGQDRAYRAVLEEHWEQWRREKTISLKAPKYTYFNVAEAHQWLMSGRPARAWDILDWFWDNQVSPGLYSWWEDSQEKTPYGLWQTVRGWVRSPHVTPHYWTAAETLLLQLAMLAYDSETGANLGCDKQDIVIGGGVPATWLASAIEARGLRLRCGMLDWRWDGRTLFATWRGGAHGRFLTGPSFPAGTEIHASDLLPHP